MKFSKAQNRQARNENKEIQIWRQNFGKEGAIVAPSFNDSGISAAASSGSQDSIVLTTDSKKKKSNNHNKRRTEASEGLDFKITRYKLCLLLFAIA